MSEFQNNPLNDFLAQMEQPESNPAPLEVGETVQEQNTEQAFESDSSSMISEQPAIPQEDPFTLALQAAKQKSEQRKIEEFAENDAVFSYGKANDPITDRNCTFEDLRVKYQTDFPELSDSKKVSWTMAYRKITKSVSNPASDKVYDLKSEIEKSKSFLDEIKKAKNDSDKNPECKVKPRVMAQSKGEMQIPEYKDYCASEELAEKSNKPIIVIPSRNGKLYEMRKNQIGTFIAPADYLPEFPEMKSGFKMGLPKKD